MFIRRIFHAIFGYFVFIFATAIVWFPVCIIGLFKTRGGYRIIDFIIRQWCRAILFGYGIKYQAKGLENIDKNKTYVVMSNHRSHFDGPILLSCLEIDMTIVIKRSLTFFPFWGWGVYLAGYISIKREDPSHSHRKISEYSKKIVEKRSILFFPEGTRSKTDEMLAFKKGGVVFAIENRLPILPVSISGSRVLLPKGSIIPKPGFAYVLVHKPISTEGYDYEERQKILKMIEEKIKEGFIPGEIKKK